MEFCILTFYNLWIPVQLYTPNLYALPSGSAQQKWVFKTCRWWCFIVSVMLEIHTAWTIIAFQPGKSPYAWILLRALAVMRSRENHPRKLCFSVRIASTAQRSLDTLCVYWPTSKTELDLRRTKEFKEDSSPPASSLLIPQVVTLAIITSSIRCNKAKNYTGFRAISATNHIQTNVQNPYRSKIVGKI